MARFWYVTDEAEGIRQFVEASNLPEALMRLKDRGISVASAGIETVEDRAPRGRVSERLLVSVYGQLATMLEDGISLPDALRALAAEAPRESLRQSLLILAKRVEEGRLLSEAMARQPTIYSPVAISVVAAAEEAGKLSEGLRSLTGHQEELAQLASQAAFPLVYPVVLLTLISGIVVFLVTFIIPKFISLFTELGLREEDFPIPTLIVMKLVRVLPWALLCIGIPVLFLVIFYLKYRRTYRGSFDLHLLGLRLPLFGQFSLHTAMARMAGTLSLLLREGVETGRALRLAGQASGHRAVSLAMRHAEVAVNQGGRLADGLRETKLLPEAFVFSLGAAEASGELVDELKRLSDDYMRRASILARTWVTISGPVIVIILGLIVGAIGFALFSPLISIISGLSQ